MSSTHYILWKSVCRCVFGSAVLFPERMIFQFPLRMMKMPICIPKTTAAVDREAANFSILWFCLPRAAPVPEVAVCVAADDVADIFAVVGALCERYLQYRLYML
jgi:hypothetical protein